FAHEQAKEVADLEYFEDLVRGVEKHRRELDAALQPFLDRGIEEVDQIERAMLRISAYELQHRLDVPYRVIIDEALRAVKRFGSEHGHTYVNGVLDHAAADWRALEMQAARGKRAAVARCRECKQCEAVPGAGHPLPTPPLCQLDLRHGIILGAAGVVPS